MSADTTHLAGNGEDPSLTQKYQYCVRSEFHVGERALPTCSHYFIKDGHK